MLYPGSVVPLAMFNLGVPTDFITYLWIIEVSRQLHKYGRQEWGDVIGERLHEGAKSKDSTGIKLVNIL